MVLTIIGVIILLVLFKKIKGEKRNTVLITSVLVFIFIFCLQLFTTILSNIDLNLFYKPKEKPVNERVYNLEEVDIQYIKVDGEDKLIKEVVTKDGKIKGKLSDNVSVTLTINSDKNTLKIEEYEYEVKNPLIRLILLNNGDDKIGRNFNIEKTLLDKKNVDD